MDFDATINESWFHDYVQLAFRLDTFFQHHIHLPYVDYYYGPPEWKTAVGNEAEKEPGALLRAATLLREQLPVQGFEPHRTTYLDKQVRAMETACRKLNGEQMSFAEELSGLFDIPFVWIPETQFDAALALYQEALPGKGTLADRLRAWRQQQSIPPTKRALLPELINQMLTEIRRRTLAFIALPENEGINAPIASIEDDHFRGVCWYEGNYRSHVEVNIDEHIQASHPVHILFDALCHEVYPGHHTAYTLREQHLYQERIYQEEMLGLIYSPAAVIGEGIATSACGMLFTPQELEAWLAQHVYPALDITPAAGDVAKIQQAADMLSQINQNAIYMFRSGQSEHEIREYLAPYMRQPHLAFWQQPFHEFFPIIEPFARQMLQPWLQGPERQHTFRRFLAEQWYPTELIK